MALETKSQPEVFGQVQLRLRQQEQMVLATIQFLLLTDLIKPLLN